MSTGTTQLLAANIDDTASALTSIGFDFYFQGARFTQFSINDNGVVRLGATAQTSTPYHPLAQAGTPSDAVNGGGINSTVTVAIPGGSLAPGASINVRFLLGVATTGNFRFYVNAEALGAGITSAPATGTTTKRRASIRSGKN